MQKTVSFGIIGINDRAFNALKSCENKLNIQVVSLSAEKFKAETLPDLSAFDVLLTSFGSQDLREQYKQSIFEALKKNSGIKIFYVGPAEIYNVWCDWIGRENIQYDPKMAQYYGFSDESMGNMLRYTLSTYFGRKEEVVAADANDLFSIIHPKLGRFEDIKTFLAAAEKNGWNLEKTHRIAIGSWRHHVIFHQPKVIEALTDEIEKQNILSVCIVADSPFFKEQLLEFRPDMVIMTSHTRETADFWEKLDVPRIHALWFMDESIEQWQKSNQPGMKKNSIQHQIISAELRGATECLAAGGTKNGGDSGEEILPIPERISHIVGRAKSWIELAKKDNFQKKIAIIFYDREADKAGLMSGPLHALNAPRSMVKFLDAMKQAGYNISSIPADEDELLKLITDHGRQFGSWEPAVLDKIAKSGQAVLVPAEKYQTWFEDKVPQWRREEMIKQWGPPPGNIMVWESNNKKYLVLPQINLGNIVLMSQPPKGEIFVKSTENPDESLFPPTHHFLATYFWMQEEFHTDALIHFGSHGSEW
ncbi:MAG: cobaltochelatase subunit CobN, partial [Phycisphaerae bacterium]|nr:cobaltochelatase subunit CobN [Phycisphaerae bacterium]